MVQKVKEGCELKPGLCHPTTVSPAVNGTCFESGKDKTIKREGWALLCICCAQDIVDL